MFLLPEKPVWGEEISLRSLGEKLVRHFLLLTIVKDYPREAPRSPRATDQDQESNAGSPSSPFSSPFSSSPSSSSPSSFFSLD
ncbi:hypothetical protein GW17_00017106 [Ensete ventricosum]|nr:hypothetical protein GW17_00017106 [Ensete ventricosum]RZS28052.1 hypothetical protein BHM03_00061603 [Ensete ventricosum]